MNYTIYKPNPKNTGNLASFRVSETIKAETGEYQTQLFVEFVPQKSWDATKRVGSFDNEQKKCVMFNLTEAGELISCIENDYPWSAVHRANDVQTNITFQPWVKDHEVGQKDSKGYWKGKKTDFVLSVYSGGKSNRIVISVGEIQVVKRILIEYIRLSMETDTKNRKQYLKNKSQ